MKVKLIFKQDSLEKKQFVNLKSDDPHITQVFCYYYITSI